MRSMPLVVHRITVTVVKVVSVNIVDESIAVVVNSITCDLAGIDPHVGLQILVIVVNSRVDNPDNDVGTGCDLPGFQAIDIGIFYSATLAEVV